MFKAISLILKVLINNMKLKEIVEICYGKSQKQVEVEKSDIPILGTGGIIGYSSMPLYNKESVLIGRKGTIGMPFYANKPFWTIDTLFYTRINTNIVIPKYLYYLLCTIGLSKYSEGAAVPSLTTKTLYEIDLNIPEKHIQQHIVNTIGTIDDLIEKKQEIIDKLKAQSTLIYKQYKGSNVALDTLSLGSVCDIKTGKLNADASVPQGSYPFFTCGQEVLNIDSYAFDGDLIIVAGNGEISVKYFNGKCNAYQRTYMLHPNKYFFVFLKESELSIDFLKNNSQGSVIKFITKGMLENISIPISKEIYGLNKKLENIYRNISNIEKQLILLRKIKNDLLVKYF